MAEQFWFLAGVLALIAASGAIVAVDAWLNDRHDRG